MWTTPAPRTSTASAPWMSAAMSARRGIKCLKPAGERSEPAGLLKEETPQARCARLRACMEMMMARQTDLLTLWRNILQAGGVQTYIEAQLRDRGYLVERRETDQTSEHAHGQH